MDFDFDFDFNDDIIDNDFITNTKTKKRIFFDLEQSFDRLKASIKLPTPSEDIRMISPAGGWSSCSLIMLIADYEVIEDLIVTTLRIGLKEAEQLSNLYDMGRLNKATIIMNGIARANKVYIYHEKINEIFGDRNIARAYINNHSKVILARTANNYYVIETSSNLNENPKIEQFTFCNDKQIYDYYIRAFKKLNIL